MNKEDIAALKEHLKRARDLEKRLDDIQTRMRRNMSLEEYQFELVNRLGYTLKRLDLSSWDPRGPNRDAFRHLLPIDSHLTKTPWWRRMMGDWSTYVEYDDSWSKTIS